jgi:DNA-binding PadR family transcriptional regulator
MLIVKSDYSEMTISDWLLWWMVLSMENKLLLLGLLRRQEMHGYQLFEFIDRDLGYCTDLKKPTAYYLLNKMAQDGWIEEEMIQDGNRPPRRVYRMTPAGEAAYQQLLRKSLEGYSPITFKGDVGLAFIDDLNPDEARRLLELRRAALQVALENAQATPPHAGVTQWVIDHQIFHLQTELDWLGVVFARLQAI